MNRNAFGIVPFILLLILFQILRNFVSQKYIFNASQIEDKSEVVD